MPSDAPVVKDGSTGGRTALPSDAPVDPPVDALPGDDLPMDAILHRLGPALDPFRSAVAEAAEEVRIYRARHEELAADPAGRMARELGPFAQGRIDPLRLAALLGDGDLADPLADRVMAVAHERFLAAGSGGAGSYRLTVPDGEDLRDAVKNALAEVGRVFATARAVEKARQRRYQPDRDHTLLHPHPFHRWSPAERVLSPPLVVEVAGVGLRGAGLLEFMEGGQKFVLLVRGKAPPAPLARLASPGVFVAQVEGREGLDAVARLAAHEGPGVVAVFEEDAGAVAFVHPGEGGIELDAAELRAAGQAASVTPGKPGLLDLRFLVGLMAAASVGPAATPAAGSDASSAGLPTTAGQVEGDGVTQAAAAGVEATAKRSPPPGESGLGRDAAEPSVDQLADWLLARTDPATG